MNKEELQSFKNELEKIASAFGEYLARDMAIGGGVLGGLSVLESLAEKIFEKTPMTGYKSKMLKRGIGGAVTLGLVGALRKNYNPPPKNNPV